MKITNDEKELLKILGIEEKQILMDKEDVIDKLEDCLSTICVKKKPNGEYESTKYEQVCDGLISKLSGR